jgi:hypothetical protein
MKEEDSIMQRVGKENAFRVPDGYFDQLTSEVMSRLPEKEKCVPIRKQSTKWERMKPWVYMAAMFIGAALIIRVASVDRTPAETVAATTPTEQVSDEDLNVIVENSMLDNYSLYVYLTDASAE